MNDVGKVYDELPLTWMVSGEVLPLVSGRRSVRPPARTEVTPNIRTGAMGLTWAISRPMKGAMMLPILEKKEQEPSPAFLTTVGKTSVEY